MVAQHHVSAYKSTPQQHVSEHITTSTTVCRNEIALQRRSIAKCIDELSVKLDSWRVSPGGHGLSADSLSQTLAMQATSLSDMTLAVGALEAHMARAGMGSHGRQVGSGTLETWLSHTVCTKTVVLW